MEKERKNYTTISIPTPLAEKIKTRIKGTGFTSLSSYVTYVLREIISSEKEETEETHVDKGRLASQKPGEKKTGNH